MRRLGEKPKEIGRFRTLDDGTFLFRKNKNTPTYHLTAEQYGEIKRLQTRENLAAYLLAPPMLLLGIKTFNVDFGLGWQIAAIYAVAYCVFNFFFSRHIWRQITRICEKAAVASPENTIHFLNFTNGLRNVLSALTDRDLHRLSLFSAISTAIGVIIFLSIYVEWPLIVLRHLSFYQKLYAGILGTAIFGGLSYFAVEEIWRRRNTEFQNPNDETNSKT